MLDTPRFTPLLQSPTAPDPCICSLNCPKDQQRLLTHVSTHRTALMCSQEAVPAMGPFCSLVRPCTVSS